MSKDKNQTLFSNQEQLIVQIILLREIFVYFQRQFYVLDHENMKDFYYIVSIILYDDTYRFNDKMMKYAHHYWVRSVTIYI